MARRQFEPLYTRWVNLESAVRKAKGDLDFGDIDPKLTADEQREDNEVSVMVDDMIASMRALATDMTGYFEIYVEDEISAGVAKALGDEDTFQKMVELLIREGKLDPGALTAATAKKEIALVESEPDVEEDVDDEEAELLKELEAEEELEASNASNDSY